MFQNKVHTVVNYPLKFRQISRYMFYFQYMKSDKWQDMSTWTHEWQFLLEISSFKWNSHIDLSTLSTFSHLSERRNLLLGKMLRLVSKHYWNNKTFRFIVQSVATKVFCCNCLSSCFHTSWLCLEAWSFSFYDQSIK